MGVRIHDYLGSLQWFACDTKLCKSPLLKVPPLLIHYISTIGQQFFFSFSRESMTKVAAAAQLPESNALHFGGVADRCGVSKFSKTTLKRKTPLSIEHGSLNDPLQVTYTLTNEDHTLANSLRYILNKDPRVSFCGFSIPHPSDALVNLRVLTTGDTAREVLVDSCQDLMFVCQHIRNTFDQAVTAFRSREGEEVIDVEK